jgi:NodT family efflux transporter outer membrane factor (OMF) lipoprotein
MNSRLHAVLLPALLLAAGCTVGPDFEHPPAPDKAGYGISAGQQQTASTAVPGGAAQRVTPGRDVPAEWWTLFHSPALDRLIAAALKNNPNLAATEAALRQAHELTLAGEGALFPSVAANVSATGNKTAATLSPATASGNLYYSLHSTGLTVSYIPDLFGGTRRQIEVLAAQEEAQRFALEAAYLTLTSNLVAAAVTEAALRGQITATEEIIGVQRQSLDILRRQQALGQVAGADVAAQEAALAQAESTLPPLQKQLSQQRKLLTALAGKLPGEPSGETFELSSLQLPGELPLSLPSRLVEQRPDIRAAEAQLHAASAGIGVSIAARLPQVTLSANPGLTATTFGQLFTPGAAFWSVGGSAMQSLFDAGTLFHKQQAAEAAFDQAAATYRSTVQAAFQNVSDALHAIDIDAKALQTAAGANEAAAKSLAIAQRQLRLGAINYLGVLTAENAYAQARINLVIAQAARFANSAALYQALGGGWWNRNDLAHPDDRDHRRHSNLS